MGLTWKNISGWMVAWLLISQTRAATLTDWSKGAGDAGSFRFHLQCESNLSYQIQWSTNLQNWFAYQRSSGATEEANRPIEIPPTNSPHMFWRAMQTNEPVFPFALQAKHGIDLNGNNLATDSYDSSNPAYSTNGRWDVTKRRDHGDMACNDTITNNAFVGNLNVWGRVATGPFPVPVGPNGAVGVAAWQVGGNHGIQPGFASVVTNTDFPDVALPSGSAAWSPPPGSGPLPSGDYRVPFTVGSSITVVPNAKVRLRVDGGWSYNGNDSLTILSNASIKIYLNCTNAGITGNGIINFGVPNQCLIFGTANLKTLDLGGNGEATCAVYVPYADVVLHGGGNSDQDFSGAVIANSIKLTGHYNIHFDEDLLRHGPMK